MFRARLFTFRFSLPTKIYAVNKKRRRLPFSLARSDPYAREERIRSRWRGRRLLFVPEMIKFYELHIHRERVKRQDDGKRAKENCVCMAHGTSCCWHKKAGSSYRLINGLIFRLDYNCWREQHRNVSYMHPLHLFFFLFEKRKQENKRLIIKAVELDRDCDGRIHFTVPTWTLSELIHKKKKNFPSFTHLCREKTEAVCLIMLKERFLFVCSLTKNQDDDTEWNTLSLLPFSVLSLSLSFTWRSVFRKNNCHLISVLLALGEKK